MEDSDFQMSQRHVCLSTVFSVCLSKVSVTDQILGSLTLNKDESESESESESSSQGLTIFHKNLETCEFGGCDCDYAIMRGDCILN